MPERWVLNASPIIVLARVEQEHLFGALTDEIVVPRAVAGEIEAGPVNDPARRAITDGFRLDERVIREALSRTVGEKWE